MRLRKIFRITLINLTVLIALIIVLDLISLLILKQFLVKRPMEIQTEEINKNGLTYKAFLPNYNAVNWTEQHFRDLLNCPSNYKSYYGWRRKQFKSETINISQNGIRFTEFVTTDTEDSPKIVFLGGSTMWGTGVNDNNTIPSIFARDYNRNANILNFGESGYGAYQSYLFLQTSMIREDWKPALVITYDGVNDNPYSHPNMFSHSRERQIRKRMSAIRSTTKLDTVDHNIRSYLFGPTRTLFNTIVKKRIEGEIIQEQIDSNIVINYPNYSRYKTQSYSEEHHEEVAIELLESWLLLKELCEKIGSNFICILQPNAYYGNPNITHLEKSGLDPRYRNIEYYDHIRTLIHDNKYQDLKNHFLDLTHVFNNKPNIYIDYCHVSPNGNEIITALIIEYLNKK